MYSSHTAHFHLGVESVTAKNDGGYNIVKLEEKPYLVEKDGHYVVEYKEKEWSDWLYGRRRALPVLSIEVFNSPYHSKCQGKTQKT